MENSFPKGIQYLKQLFENGKADHFQEKLINFFPALIYVYDTDKKQMSYVNQKVTEWLGYSFDDLHTWHNDFLQLVFHDDVDTVKQELDKFNHLPDDTDYYGFNCRLKHKEGNWRYFRTQGLVLNKDESGKPSSLLFVASDITNELKSQEEIRAMREMMDDNENLLQFGSWSWDLQTGKATWSNGMYEIYGYTREELNGMLTHDMVQEHVQEKDRQGLQQTIQAAITHHSKFQHQYRITRKDGREAIILTNGKAVTDNKGEVVKIVGNTRDITEQAMFQEILLNFRQTQAERETFLAYGSWEANMDNTDLKLSDGMLTLFGYDPAKREEYSIGIQFLYRHINPEYLPKIQQARKEAEAADGYYIISYPITTPGGEQKKLESFARIVRNAQGEAVKVYGTTRDITQLQEYEKTLEAKIRELNRSNKELEEFAYVASHDLQEPLRKLTTFSERLAAKHKEEMDREVRMYVDRIVFAADNMRTLIDNLLEFSRVTRSAQQYRPTNLNQVIAEVREDLDMSIEETGASIVVPGPLPEIEAIPSQMKQLFVNLVSNSLKFRRKGRPPVVHITTYVAGEQEQLLYDLPLDTLYHCIVVKDNGIGFEQEYAERIFQIFQRLHGKVEYPGSGVGLAICKKIAENHNGKIFATGAVETGAVFTLLLPEQQ